MTVMVKNLDRDIVPLLANHLIFSRSRSCAAYPATITTSVGRGRLRLLVTLRLKDGHVRV